MYVIHRVEDVTEFVRLKAREGEQDRRAEELRGHAERMEAEVFLRGQELARSNADLRRQIDERERAEAALAREQDFLRAVLDHAADGIVACDERGRAAPVQPRGTRVPGIPSSPLAPEQWAEHYNLYQPDGKTRLPRAGAAVPRVAEGFGQGRGDGDRRRGAAAALLTANGQAITAADGRTLGAVVVMHDVTGGGSWRGAAGGERTFAEVGTQPARRMFSVAVVMTVPAVGRGTCSRWPTTRYYDWSATARSPASPPVTPCPNGGRPFELLDGVYATGEPFVGRDMRLMVQREPGGSLDSGCGVRVPAVRAVTGRSPGLRPRLDLTEHKHAEAAAGRARKRYRRLSRRPTRASGRLTRRAARPTSTGGCRPAGTRGGDDRGACTRT